jgi:hypothetical protein
VAQILLCVAVGLQFGHQILAHHHEEENAFSSDKNQNDHHDNDDDHHAGRFPAHNISHIFSPQTASIDHLKIFFRDVVFHHEYNIDIPKAEILITRIAPRRYWPPPLPDYYNYFSLRAPPAC